MLNIERVLKEKRMTQQNLADRLGVTVQAVNSAICGRSQPSDRLLRRYADAIGVTYEDLFDDFLN